MTRRSLLRGCSERVICRPPKTGEAAVRYSCHIPKPYRVPLFGFAVGTNVDQRLAVASGNLEVESEATDGCRHGLARCRCSTGPL